MRYQLIVDVSERLVGEVVRLLHTTWWANARNPDDVCTLLRNTTASVALFDQSAGRMVAFARAMSDGVFRAMIYDVVVDPALRGTGLGEQIVRAIMQHPRLRGVEVVELRCLPDLAPFYGRFGFEPPASGSVGLARRNETHTRAVLPQLLHDALRTGAVS